MVTLNPDEAPEPITRAAADTIGQMMAREWRVLSHCSRCRLQMFVDLPTLAQLRGPDFSLWNRHPVCRSIGCFGRVTFEAQPKQPASFQRLVDVATLPDRC